MRLKIGLSPQQHFGIMQALQADLHGIMDLKKRQAEYQLAVYMGGGSQYVKHRDARPDDGASANERRVSCSLASMIALPRHDLGHTLLAPVVESAI